ARIADDHVAELREVVAARLDRAVERVRDRERLAGDGQELHGRTRALVCAFEPDERPRRQLADRRGDIRRQLEAAFGPRDLAARVDLELDGALHSALAISAATRAL